MYLVNANSLVDGALQSLELGLDGATADGGVVDDGRQEGLRLISMSDIEIFQ